MNPKNCPKTRSFYTLNAKELDLQFGMVILKKTNIALNKGVVVVKAMIAKSSLQKSIPYTEDFNIIHKHWEELMDGLLSSIYTDG